MPTPLENAKFAQNISIARHELDQALSSGANPEMAIKNLRLAMEEAFNTGAVASSSVKTQYESALNMLLHRVPESLVVQSAEADYSRQVERGGISLGSLLIGFGTGWLVFGRKGSSR